MKKAKNQDSITGTDPFEIRIEITNQRGLHARASAAFAKKASEFRAKVKVHRDGMSAEANSIMDLLMLAAFKGSYITISGQGDDAEAAVWTLAKLVENKFGEAS